MEYVMWRNLKDSRVGGGGGARGIANGVLMEHLKEFIILQGTMRNISRPECSCYKCFANDNFEIYTERILLYIFKILIDINRL